MNILHVTDEGAAVPGGRETHIAAFSSRVSSLGHTSNVVTLGTVALELEQPEVVLLHSREAWASASDIRRKFPASTLIAWVHDQSFVCAASISWFRKTREECRLPLGAYCFTNAYTLRCNARRPDRNLGNCLKVKRSLDGIPALDGIIVASRYMKERMISGGAPEAIIHVLPYFVDAPGDQSQSASRSNRRVLYVGRLNETKGVDILIDAMHHLPRDVELVIAGDGYIMNDLKERASAYDSPPGRIRFVGHLTGLDQVESAYRSADVVAVPSLWPEPFGIVGLEAMSNGLPVVGSRVGGIPEWLRDGATGYLTEPGNPIDLARRLLLLLENDQMRNAFGQNALNDVRSRYSWENHWNSFVDIVKMSGRTS